jgi:hypothetical protein
MEKMRVYGVVLPAETARRLRVAAALQGLSRSRLVRNLVETYLAQFVLDQAVQFGEPGAGQPGQAGSPGAANDSPGAARCILGAVNRSNDPEGAE